MKMKLLLAMSVLLVFVGCRSGKMTAAEEAEPERPTIEKDTEIAVEVDDTTGIMSLEEKFDFASQEDEEKHEEKSFFVIIGSFRNSGNAENYKLSMRDKGFDPVILLSETGLHRVSVDAFHEEDQARNRILAIRNQFQEHEDTWLLIRK